MPRPPPTLRYLAGTAPTCDATCGGERLVNYWHGHGKKIADESGASPEVMAYVNNKMPEFMGSDAPWVNRTDSYLDYKNHRKPVLE